MSCDVTRGVDANGTDFSVVNPHASVLGGLGRDSMPPAQVNDCLLDVAHVPPDAGFEVLEIYDRISDELTRTMESDKAASICFVKLRSQVPEFLFVVDCVIFGTDADCVHWRVLIDDDNVLELVAALHQSIRDVLLQF